MRGSIQARRWKLGGELGADPEYIEELEARRARHERVTRNKPARPFGALLRQQRAKDAPPPEPPPTPSRGARDPLLGLDPNQDARLANPGPGRSGRVIVKG